MTKKGKFIVLEGIDGSGTSTQLEKLKNSLLDNNIKTVSAFEPSDSPIGNLIREIFKGRVLVNQDNYVFNQQMMLLMAADRCDHINNEIDGIKQFLDKGITVICSRYILSSLAYHGITEDDYQQVLELNKNFIQPDLTIYVDNPVELSIKRMSSRAFKDTYENSKKLTKVYNNYKKILKRESFKKLLVVSGNDTIENIHSKIKASALELY